MRTSTIAIDIAKEKFHVFGVDAENRVTLDKALGRRKLLQTLSNHQPVDVYMESCAGSNALCHKLNSFGHTAKRISPQHVKPFVGTQKNDRNDAKAILEASRRPEALFVGLKNQWQLDLQCLHKMRDRALKNFKALNSQIRGFLFEYEILISQSTNKFFKEVPKALEDWRLSTILREELYELFSECKKAYEKSKSLEKKLEQLCSENLFFQRAIEELPGVGSLVASRFLATISSSGDFKNGRQVAAHLGLVPRQMSSGGKTKLLGITKHGDVGLRTMLIQGARASLASLSRRQYLGVEHLKMKKLIEDKGFNKAAVALANKNARQMWAIMNK